MRMSVRLDSPPQIAIQDLIGLAVLAEERGYETVWVPEGGGRDSLTQLSAFAMATNKIQLGSGILPVFSRTPTLIAMSAIGLDVVSNHRFILGLGTGHQAAAEKSHGVAFKKPFVRIRETVHVVRRLLDGERVFFQGEAIGLTGASLGMVQGEKVSLYLAALGPRMLELAGEIADGVLLNWAAPSYIQKALLHLKRGADRAGRRVEDIDVAAYIRVAVVANEEIVHAPLRRQIMRYLNMEYYRNFLMETGFEEEIRAIDECLRRGDMDKASSAISNEMERALAVFGSPEYCRDEIERRRALGVKAPVIAPFAVGGALNSYRSTIETFGD